MVNETQVEAKAAAEAPAKVAQTVADTVETVVAESAKVAKRTRATSARRAKRQAVAQKNTKTATKANARRTTRKTRSRRQHLLERQPPKPRMRIAHSSNCTGHSSHRSTLSRQRRRHRGTSRPTPIHGSDLAIRSAHQHERIPTQPARLRHEHHQRTSRSQRRVNRPAAGSGDLNADRRRQRMPARNRAKRSAHKWAPQSNRHEPEPT